MRFTASLGLPVLEQETAEVLGRISGMLLHPDTGRVEGFFVRTEGFFSHEDLFLSPLDIVHWGMRIIVRNRDALSPPEERVRLQPLLDGKRPVLGQPIVTQRGRPLGRCSDVQFSTRDYVLQWLFPRRFFRWGLPIPASQILEVRLDAIVVREPSVGVQEKEAQQEEIAILPPMPEAA